VTDALTIQASGSGMNVAGIAPGALKDYYGIAAGDEILAAGDFELNQTKVGEAKNLIQMAYQTKKPLKVNRGGEKIDLPIAGGAAPTAPAPTPAPAAKAPTPAPAQPTPSVNDPLAPLKGLPRRE